MSRTRELPLTANGSSIKSNLICEDLKLTDVDSHTHGKSSDNKVNILNDTKVISTDNFPFIDDNEKGAERSLCTLNELKYRKETNLKNNSSHDTISNEEKSTKKVEKAQNLLTKGKNVNSETSHNKFDCIKSAEFVKKERKRGKVKLSKIFGQTVDCTKPSEDEQEEHEPEIIKCKANDNKCKEKHSGGAVVRVIITKLKHTPEEKTAKTSSNVRQVPVHRAPKDVNHAVNETTLEGDLDCEVVSGKMCSGVTKIDESGNHHRSVEETNEGGSEMISQSDIKEQSNLVCTPDEGVAGKSVASSDQSSHGVLLEDDEDDPYIELQEYLERIKREINEVFEQHKIRNSEELQGAYFDTDKNNLLENEKTCTKDDKNDKSETRDGNNKRSASHSRWLSECDKEKQTLEDQLKALVRRRQHSIEESKDLSNIKSQDGGDINIWASNILSELDKLMGQEKRASAKFINKKDESDQKRNQILKPEKHATIPLQSFNLNVPLAEHEKSVQPKKHGLDKELGKMYKNESNEQTKAKEATEKQSDEFLVLKIEEGNKGETGKVEGTINTSLMPRKDECQRNVLYLNDVSKKGSTSTIWTSEESILKSAGAVDEDNKSTSSSTCEETSVALSSGKSGNSLDSSGIDNENSHDVPCPINRTNNNNFWTVVPQKRVHQNNSDNFNLYVTQKNRYLKNDLVTSTDDPDLLEILSLCGGGNCDEDLLESNIACPSSIEYSNEKDEDEVILRNKLSVQPHRFLNYIAPPRYNPSRKSRSHSVTETSLSSLQSEYDVYSKICDTAIKPKRPSYLPLSQDFFRSCNSSNMRELPSPSSASLHSANENFIIQELTTKSNSAPVLLKKEKKNDLFSGHQNSLRYSRSQSDRYLAEIEAIEACKWLRAAGFPQYAQMYEDHQFPIDLTSVAKDHPILENDPLQSLYRRLCILNRCATMRLDSIRKHGQQKEDSDDEGFALSENWTFQPQSRRWSRVGETGLEIPCKQLQDKAECSSKDSSPDRFEEDLNTATNLGFSTLPLRPDDIQTDSDPATARLRRTGSERLKDGAKAFLRRVESIKSRRRKRQNRGGLVISGPQALDLNSLEQKDLKTVTVTLSNPPSPSPTSPVNAFPRHLTTSKDLKVPMESERFLSPNRLSPKRVPSAPRSAHSMRTSPLHFFANPMPHLIEGKSDDSSSYCSDSQESSSGLVTLRRQPSRSRRLLQRTGKVDDIGIHSDSECHQQHNRKMIVKDTNSNNTEVKVKKLARGGSLNLGRDGKKRTAFQSRSFRSRSSVRRGQPSESDKEDNKLSKSPVVRWHSFQDNDKPPVVFKKCAPSQNESRVEGTLFASMSCGQLQIIRKLALVTLTGYMERYCPTHRSGWNWELPKFIKKIKTPDYKDKKVFGVPLLLVLQRTGHALPFPIRVALRWLRLNAFDQIGLFRKSGVKSRIAKLKELIESSDIDCMDIYDTQQAYDIADMLKQYFRDLPECLLTSKMSETFVAIFHHLPLEVRGDAVQSAVLLLPDENREVLFTILEFLNQVAANSQFNQMTANNLAVCWAPSLFNNNTSTGRSSSVSPRRRKVAGVPDIKELSETRASHECLTYMISHFKEVFTASREKILRCNFGYMEESKPVPLEALGEGMQFQNWRGYLYECTSATIKEGREKTRGWINAPSLEPNVDIAFKKVGDGHPLRLWRCVVDVEAPPIEVLDYILKDRSTWDINLIKSRVIQKLDDRSEIFQYACDGQTLTDYCVLRSWQSDLPKGACVIVETSVEHSSAPVMSGAVRGVVLASRYLIEPCGGGRSRVMHLARVDTKGRTPEWYNKCYGHICSHYLSRIRAAFRHVADGPESKV